jgi:hypothetical protein
VEERRRGASVERLARLPVACLPAAPFVQPLHSLARRGSCVSNVTSIG